MSHDTSTFIKRHISQLPDNQLFTTRDMLKYGKRATVDVVLWRLVHIGEIIRIARGLFTRYVQNFKCPSALEIAQVKAKGFGKEICIYEQEAARKLGFTDHKNSKETFANTGCTTSFGSMAGRIYLHGSAPRKRKPDDKPKGLAIRALWFLGITKAKLSHMEKATASFSQKEWLKFVDLAGLMPWWMSNMLVDRQSAASKKS